MLLQVAVRDIGQLTYIGPADPAVRFGAVRFGGVRSGQDGGYHGPFGL